MNEPELHDDERTQAQGARAAQFVLRNDARASFWRIRPPRLDRGRRPTPHRKASTARRIQLPEVVKGVG